MVYCRNVKRTGERNPNMSCDIVSDLTISAIVCAMAGTEYGAAGLHDDDGTFYSAATCSQKVGQILKGTPEKRKVGFSDLNREIFSGIPVFSAMHP